MPTIRARIMEDDKVMEPPTARYKAFLSYSHRDEDFVRRFHKALERWRIPRAIVGQETPNGPVPPSLRPIFRDRDDFSGGSDLKEAMDAALKESEYLIVFCSPQAAASPHVNEEVRLFKAMGRADKVIPVIISGEPNSRSNECFPEAIRHRVGLDGKILAEMAEPIAADARELGDGKKRALAKVVAGILEVPFDELIRRAERAGRNRRSLLVGAAAGAFLFATAFASYALYRGQQAERSISKSVFALGRLVQETDRLGDADIEESRQEMLRTLCDLMESLAEDPADIGLIERTVCLCEQAHAVARIGDNNTALEGLSAWLDRLLTDFDATEAPGFDQATALVKASREWALLKMELADDDEVITSNFANLMATIAEVGSKRPDITYIRTVHEEVIWNFLERLESDGAYKRSLAFMDEAVELRGLQAEAETDNAQQQEILLERAVFLRRGAWLLGTQLADQKLSLERARDASAALEKLVPTEFVDGGAQLQYERVIALNVWAEALAQGGDPAGARQQYAQALALAEEIRARFDDENEEDALEYAQLIEYLRAQMEQLEGVGQ